MAIFSEAYEFEKYAFFVTNVSGSVGQPLPGVAVRIVSEENEKPGSVIMEATESTCNILSKTEEIKGTLEVKGDAVFQQYWRKPEATKREFTQDGWFKTGKFVITVKLVGCPIARKNFQWTSRRVTNLIIMMYVPSSKFCVKYNLCDDID